MTGFKKGYRVVFKVGLCWPGIAHVHHNPRQRWNLMIAHPRPLLAAFAALLAQVLELGRHVLWQNTGEERVEVVYGGTSLTPERATPGRLLALVQGQGPIEHQSHGVRNVTFEEDHSQVCRGNIPHGFYQHSHA
jgi:hypothetical protein